MYSRLNRNKYLNVGLLMVLLHCVSVWVAEYRLFIAGVDSVVSYENMAFVGELLLREELAKLQVRLYQ